LSIPCPNCGRLNRPGARFCASCQTPLDGSYVRVQPGQLLDGGTYRIVRPLGKGGMGAVWLVAQTKAFDRLAVLKEVVEYYDPTNAEEGRKAAERFEAEARTLGALKHPGIPDLYAYFSEGGHNYLVMEYVEGPDLRKWLTREDESTGKLVPGGRLPQDDVLRYMIEICQVLEYLAGRQPPVVHNDIKPGNIIIDEHSGRAVLVDFGTAMARYLKAAGQPDQNKDELYGTVGYAAPELYRGHSEPRSDVYSLAATAYHLLTDDDPGDHPAQYLKLGMLPPALADVLRAGLAPDVADRPTATEFRQKLETYLGGWTGRLQALTFPDGDSAGEREALLALAVKHWSYAAGILADGTIANWLRHTLRDAVAAQAADAAVGQWPNNPDAVLDAFIRQLSPSALPPGVMEVRTSSLRLPGLEPDQRIELKIEIANRGRGYLRGEVSSTQPWLRVDKSFACPPGRSCDVTFEIKTAGLAPGQPHLAAVTLAPAGGTPEVVAVQIGVAAGKDTPAAGKAAPAPATPAAPAIEVRPALVDFGTVDTRNLSTPPATVTVKNVSQDAAQVRVQGMPGWLLVKPEAFWLVPGAEQAVTLVGRTDRLSAGAQKVIITLALDAGAKAELEVRLKVKRRGLFG
jgi:serine/threonine protein kinase